MWCCGGGIWNDGLQQSEALRAGVGSPLSYDLTLLVRPNSVTVFWLPELKVCSDV